MNLSDEIQIKNNSVSVKTSQNLGFNKSAEITLYGIGDRGFLNPVIKINTQNCPSNVCVALTPLNAQNVKFNVTGFILSPITTYGVGEGSSRILPPPRTHDFHYKSSVNEYAEKRR